jgi:hypothetical protein
MAVERNLHLAKFDGDKQWATGAKHVKFGFKFIINMAINSVTNIVFMLTFTSTVTVRNFDDLSYKFNVVGN